MTRFRTGTGAPDIRAWHSAEVKGEGDLDSADFDALEAKAREKLSPAAYVFAAAGADDELTIAGNIAAWRRLRLRPRVLNDITKIDTSVRVLGSKLATPIMV